MRRSQIDGFVYNFVKKRQLMFLPCPRIGQRKLLQKPEKFAISWIVYDKEWIRATLFGQINLLKCDS